MAVELKWKRFEAYTKYKGDGGKAKLCLNQIGDTDCWVRAKLPHGWLVAASSSFGASPGFGATGIISTSTAASSAFVPNGPDGTGWGPNDDPAGV